MKYFVHTTQNIWNILWIPKNGNSLKVDINRAFFTNTDSFCIWNNTRNRQKKLSQKKYFVTYKVKYEKYFVDYDKRDVLKNIVLLHFLKQLGFMIDWMIFFWVNTTKYQKTNNMLKKMYFVIYKTDYIKYFGIYKV